MTHQNSSTADRMLQRPTVLTALGRIARSLTRNPHRAEDLRQDASLHLWQQLQRHPGHRWSWYLQGFHFHLLDELSHGSSIDSFKHHSLAIEISDEDNPDAQMRLKAMQTEHDPLSHICADDIFDRLRPHLTPTQQMVLRYLFDGFSGEQTAHHLGISHQAVTSIRRKIAHVALRLGISLTMLHNI